MSVAVNVDALTEVVLEALCASDNGNNPFYRDDADTVSLAREVAEAVAHAMGYDRQP